MESDFLKTDIGRSLLPILSDAGFEKGDFLPLVSLTPLSDRYVGTTSTTWDGQSTFFYQNGMIWDEYFPPGSTTIVKFSLIASPGTDETLDFRMRNRTDGENLIEVTGITSETMDTWVNTYTPSTTASPLDIISEIRTDPGANSSYIKRALLVIGVKV